MATTKRAVVGCESGQGPEACVARQDALRGGAGSRKQRASSLLTPSFGSAVSIRSLPNMPLLLSRFASIASGCSPCSEHPPVTIVAAQQNG